MSFINVEAANSKEWNSVQPVAEMMGGPKPRCLNPGLKFKVDGLEALKVYTAGIVFVRSSDKYSFSKDNNCWLPWKSGIDQFPEQRFVMDPTLGADLNYIDFSKMTFTTNEKAPVKEDQIIVQTHHVYKAILTITDMETQEVSHFDNDYLQFIVITNSNPRYKAQKQLLDALQEPEKTAKKMKKEELAQKRAEKKLKRPAPEPEYVNRYAHLIGTDAFEKMKPRFIIRRDPPAQPPAKLQRIEKDAQVVQPVRSLPLQPAHPVAKVPEFVPADVFYDPAQYPVLDQVSTSGSESHSPLEQQNENVPPADNQQYLTAPVSQFEERNAEGEDEFLSFSPSKFDLKNGGIAGDFTLAYLGDFVDEDWQQWRF